MKQFLLSCFMAATVLGLVACGNDNNTSGSTTNSDTTTGSTAGTTGNNSTDGTATGTAGAANSTSDYSAFADSVERNSAAGYYVNPRTGKSMKLRVNRQTGAVTDDRDQPVYRYVDNRNWWVYGLDESDWTWRQQGEARMDDQKKSLTYKGDNEQWVGYEQRYKMTDEERLQKSWKQKYGDTKVKVDKDGDIKVKTEEGKVKYDADDKKIKTDKDN